MDTEQQPHSESESRTPSRAGSIGLVSAGTVIAFGLNLLIQVVLAARFGASKELDAYFLALVIPNTITLMLTESLVNVFLPMFVERRVVAGEKDAWKFASFVISVSAPLLLVSAVGGMVGAPALVAVLAPGFDATSQAMATRISQVVFPIIVLGGLSSIATGIFYSYDRFRIPVVAQLLRTATNLALVWLLTVHLGIIGAALGVTISYGINLLILVASLRGKRPLYHLTVKELDPTYLKLFRLWAVLMSASFLYKSFPIIDRYLASGLPEGSISYLSYAATIVTLTGLLFSSSIATVLFPTLARDLATENVANATATMSLSIRISAFLVVPFVAGLMVLREPIVRLVLERGAFTAQDTRALSATILFSAGALLAPVFSNTTSKMLYSMKAMGFLFALSAIMVPLYVVLCLLLIRPLGFLGIALATSIRMNASWVIHLVYLRSRLGNLNLSNLGRSLAYIGACALVMGLACYYVYTQLGLRSNLPLMTQVISVAFTALCGVVIYAGLSLLFRIEEARLIRQRLIALTRKA